MNTYTQHLETLRDGNNTLLALYSQLPEHEKPHYAARMAAIISAPSRMLVYERLRTIPSTGMAADAFKTGDPSEVVKVIKEQFAQGRGTWRTLINILGKYLLKRIVRL